MSGIEAGMRRIEWRGDLFAADLDEVSARLVAWPLIPRPFEHTLTFFLHPVEDDWDVATAIRMRAYRNLPEVSAGAVSAVLSAGVEGKLQAKSPLGRVEQLGPVLLRTTPDGGAPLLTSRGRVYRAHSVRVSAREHRSFSPGAAAPFGPAAELRRITVDRTRALFRIDPAAGTVTSLGDLGPRLEIKAPTRAAVDTLRQVLDADGAIRVRPNASLALLFQDVLRQRIDPAPAGFPEMEIKFDVPAGLADADADAVAEAIADTFGVLLPAPGRIERVRRYHVCHDGDAGAECTVVETASGRLSAKRKRGERRLGSALLRDTIASRTTDTDGALCSVVQFTGELGWTRMVMFEKAQTKIPFALPEGRAYLISLDRCTAGQGRLDQVEIEFIGTVPGTPFPTAQTVADDLMRLGDWLVAGPLGGRLVPGSGSKHAFFRAMPDAASAGCQRSASATSSIA